MTSPMLGWNQNVRKVPLNSNTMNDHSAISPSMNDQCSGKTLRSGISLLVAARPMRSSSHAVGPAAALPTEVFSMGVYSDVCSGISLVQFLLVARELGVARRHDVGEVTQRDQVAVCVEAEG